VRDLIWGGVSHRADGRGFMGVSCGVSVCC
jgi:hypothetical protein